MFALRVPYRTVFFVGTLFFLVFAFVLPRAKASELDLLGVVRTDLIIVDSSIDLAGNLYTIERDVTDSSVPRSVSKYSTTGDLIWGRSLNTVGGGLPGRITVNPQGDIFVGGNITDSGDPDLGETDIYVSKFSSSLDLQWTTNLGSPGEDYLGTLQADNRGNVFFGGIVSKSNRTRLYRDAALGKLNRNGNVEWITNISARTRGWNNAGVTGLAIRSDQSVVAVGSTSQSPDGEHLPGIAGFVGQYSPSGELDWFSTSRDTATGSFEGVDLDRAGNAIVGGVKNSTGDVNAVAAKYDISGNLVWEQVFDVSSFGGYVKDVKTDSLGNAIIVGADTPAIGSLPDTFTIRKYSPNGSEIAVADFGPFSASQKFTRPQTIEIDPFGRVSVLGRSGSDQIADETPQSGKQGFILGLGSSGARTIDLRITFRAPQGDNEVDISDIQPEQPVGSPLKRWNGTSFSGDLTEFDASNPTVVLTHGWNSSPGTFSGLANAIAANPNVNVLAWDWQEQAGTGTGIALARSRTPFQAKQLATELAEALGGGYNEDLHFIGHSLGALVTGEAIDELVEAQGVTSSRIQATLLDNAALTNLTQISVANLLGSNVFADPTSKYAYNENYVSVVGRLYDDAVNIFLPDGAAAGVVEWHSYPISWYEQSALAVRSGTAPDNNTPGYQDAFETGAAIPQHSKYYIQTLNFNDSPLLLRESTESEIDNWRSLARKFGAGASIGKYLLDREWDAVGGVDAVLKEDAQGDLKVEIMLTEQSPAYVWVPVAIPEGTAGFSFDFRFFNTGDEDFLSFGIADELLFAIEGEYILAGEFYNSGIIDIGRYAGRDEELFFALNSDGITGASIFLDNLTFYAAVPEPNTAAIAFLSLIGIVCHRRRSINVA